MLQDYTAFEAFDTFEELLCFMTSLGETSLLCLEDGMFQDIGQSFADFTQSLFQMFSFKTDIQHEFLTVSVLHPIEEK